MAYRSRIIKGFEYVNRAVKGTFHHNSYVYYLWKRSVEYQKNYYFYGVNAAHYNKYYFEPDHRIYSEMEKVGTGLINKINNNDLIINILIKVASSLLIEKYYLWENHVNKMMRNMNELELMMSLRNECLYQNECLSKDILVLIDNESNCNMFID